MYPNQHPCQPLAGMLYNRVMHDDRSTNLPPPPARPLFAGVEEDVPLPANGELLTRWSLIGLTCTLLAGPASVLMLLIPPLLFAAPLIVIWLLAGCAIAVITLNRSNEASRPQQVRLVSGVAAGISGLILVLTLGLLVWSLLSVQ